MFPASELVPFFQIQWGEDKGTVQKQRGVGGRETVVQYTLCISVDVPEPGEALTYCFAPATWHLIGRRELGFTDPFAGETAVARSQRYQRFPRGLLYCHSKTLTPSWKNAISPVSPTAYYS